MRNEKRRISPDLVWVKAKNLGLDAAKYDIFKKRVQKVPRPEILMDQEAFWYWKKGYSEGISLCK